MLQTSRRDETLISDLGRKAHGRAFKLCAACASLVFVATGGLTGMQMHPLSPHPESHDLFTMEMGADAPSMVAMLAGHWAHHSGSPHGSMAAPSLDCACLGPCQGGAAPSLADLGTLETAFRQTWPSHATAPRGRVIHQDPRSYLLPLPNPPPARA